MTGGESRIVLDVAQAPAPDPARGVFETVLAIHGRPVHWGRHRSRLQGSARTLYGRTLPSELDAEVARCAADHVLARLRVDVTAAAVTLTATALGADERFAPADVALAAVRVSSGHGAHKFADRAWLERIEAAVDPQARALLVSRVGGLLETTRANVFLLRGGALATPRLDGSILPGVMRDVMLADARQAGIPAREAALTLEDLAQADVVLLTSSLRLERCRLRVADDSDAAADALAGAVRDGLGWPHHVTRR